MAAEEIAAMQSNFIRQGSAPSIYNVRVMEGGYRWKNELFAACGTVFVAGGQFWDIQLS
jgi:hypothetical protein